jgi:prophage regulatory protein
MKITEVLPVGGLSRQFELLKVLPFSGPTLWRKCKDDEFPKPIKIGEKMTAWRNDEVNMWFAEMNAKSSEATQVNPIKKATKNPD